MFLSSLFVCLFVLSVSFLFFLVCLFVCLFVSISSLSFFLSIYLSVLAFTQRDRKSTISLPRLGLEPTTSERETSHVISVIGLRIACSLVEPSGQKRSLIMLELELTHKSPVVTTVCTARFNIHMRSAHTAYLCVLCGSQNKQRLFPYTTLTDCFL
jgi:hypothetical protein